MFAPPRAFFLPEWPEPELETWNVLTARAVRLTSRAGTGVQFGRLVEEIRELVRAGQFATIDARLPERRFARALVTLWHDDEELARASLTSERLARLLDAQAPRLSRLTTINLIAVLLKHFDLLDEWQENLLSEVGEAAKHAVQNHAASDTRNDVVEVFRRDHAFMTHVRGPSHLAQMLVANGTSLDDYTRSNGLLGYDGGRFGARLRESYFLEQIHAADHTSAEHAFLNEVTSRFVMKARGSGGLFFGHDVLRALADKPDAPPSDQWLQAILDIGKDPRLRSTPDWRTWWEPLPERTVRQVTRWMSVEDLRLFLLAVENFGREEGVVHLSRLFPPRKQFLWGLYESGLVKETRLILGQNVRNSVRRQVGRIRTDAALLDGLPNTAIIVVDCGDFHIVEGSHHFKMWIYAGAVAPELTDRSRRTYSADELRNDVSWAHSRRHPDGYAAQVDITHRGLWQRKALEFLIERYGFPIDPRSVLTPEDYNQLKYKHGLPVHRQPRGR